MSEDTAPQETASTSKKQRKKPLTPTQKLQQQVEQLQRENDRLKGVSDEPLVPLNARIPKSVRDRVRVFALTHDTTIQFMVEASLIEFMDARESRQGTLDI